MKKFAAIFAAVLLTVSVFMVSASAKLFSASNEYIYSGTMFNLPYTTSTAIGPLYQFYVTDVDGNVLFSYGSESDFYLMRLGSVVDGAFSEPVFKILDSQGASSAVTVLDTVFTAASIPGNARVKLYSTSDALSFGTQTTVSNPALVSSLSDSVFTSGSSLVDFVVSNWITLVPIVAFLVVLSIGAIRRLVKGV